MGLKILVIPAAARARSLVGASTMAGVLAVRGAEISIRRASMVSLPLRIRISTAAIRNTVIDTDIRKRSIMRPGPQYLTFTIFRIQKMVTYAGIMMVIGILWIRKIVNVKY